MNLDSLHADVQQHVDEKTSELLPIILQRFLCTSVSTSCIRHAALLRGYIKAQIALSKAKRHLREHYNCDCETIYNVRDGINIYSCLAKPPYVSSCLFEKRVYETKIYRDAHRQIYHDAECLCLVTHK